MSYTRWRKYNFQSYHLQITSTSPPNNHRINYPINPHRHSQSHLCQCIINPSWTSKYHKSGNGYTTMYVGTSRTGSWFPLSVRPITAFTAPGSPGKSTTDYSPVVRCNWDGNISRIGNWSLVKTTNLLSHTILPMQNPHPQQTLTPLTRNLTTS